MPTSELTDRPALSGPRRVRSRWALTCYLAVAAIGLAACGSSAKKTAANTTGSVTTPAPTTTTAADPPTAKTAPKRTAATKKTTTAASTTASAAKPAAATTQTTTTAAAATFTGHGAVALACLKASGLKHGRKAKEPGVWEANTAHSQLSNLNAIVFVDGPYKSKQAAKAAAQSLLGVEYAASGGRWEVSASLPSHLSVTVKNVAACLGGAKSQHALSF